MLSGLFNDNSGRKGSNGIVASDFPANRLTSALESWLAQTAMSQDSVSFQKVGGRSVGDSVPECSRVRQ